jgi:hypothetical protein
VSSRPGLVTAAAGTALLAVLAGCTAGGAARDSARAAHPTARVTTAASAAQLPVAAYELSPTQESEANYLGLLLEKNCMARLGFRFLPGLSPGDIALEVRTVSELNSRIWGITDPVAAREYGYHLPPWMQGPGKPQTIGSLPAAEQFALTGVTLGGDRPSRPPAGAGGFRVPAGGCQALATRDTPAGLGPNGGTGTQLMDAIGTQSFLRARSSPRVLAVFARWSACMRGRGYRYSSPFAAAASANLNGPVTRAEIRMAMTDVACKQSVGLVGVTFSVQAGYQQQMLARYAAQLPGISAQVRQESQALAALARTYRF